MQTELTRKSPATKQIVKEYFMMAGGIFLVSFGIYFFKFPNHFSTGGVTGISVLLSALFPGVPTTTFNSVLNILFLILGFLVLKRSFGIRTAYCSLLFSGLLSLFEVLFPLSAPLTDQKLLELFFAVILPAIGTAIVFNLQGSTGGTDILALILKKYTSLDIGKALICSDILIAASTFLVFDVETGLFSILGLLLKSLLVDNVAETLNRKKSFTVITENPHIACNFINETLHRGATFWQAEGAYTHGTKFVVLTALSGAQAVALRRYLKIHDPHSFILVANSSEIFGNGFMQV